jgi:DNA polymerase I-like protein with 3'-5' exonuclease and polymerase domains
VHDSIIFDVIDSEKEDLARLCVTTFRSMPSHLEKMFRFDWNVPLDGDVELGRNYGEMEKFKNF